MCGQTIRFFTRLFSRFFNCSYFRNVYQLKIFTITDICRFNKTLLRMLSLDFLVKVAKRVDFHSATVLLFELLKKSQTYLNIIRLHSTHSTRWPIHLIFPSILCRVKNRVKKRVVWPRPKAGEILFGYYARSLAEKLGLGLTVMFTYFEDALESQLHS